MDFINRPLVRQIPPPGFEFSSSGGAGATMHTNNPFSFDLGIAPPYSTATSSWSFSGGNGNTGRLDLARAPISWTDLYDDYFPRPAQFGPLPTMNPYNYYVPALLPVVPPAGGFNPTAVYDYGNPFDADGTASLAMEVPAPWDRCYDYDFYDDGHVVQPGVEEPVSVSSAAVPACNGGTTLKDDDESTSVLPKLCCLYDGYDEDIEATLRAQEHESRPSPDYLETTQGGRMSEDTRAALVGWMSRLTQCYGLAAATLHRAVSYTDRFLSVRPLEDDAGMTHWLRLLGAAAVYAAAKYEDQGTAVKLGAAEIARYGGGGGGDEFASSKEEVLDMERALLVALDYRLGRPTAHTFVEHFTRHYDGQEELELRSCAHDFADMSLLHYGCLRHNPSAVAAAAMFLARLALKPSYGEMKRWNRDFVELTGYEPKKLERCVEAMLYATSTSFQCCMRLRTLNRNRNS